MRQYKAILSTTHLDKQGEHMTREDIEDLAEVANQFYIPTGYDHDPRIPPAGRIVSASVEPIEDGHHALYGIIELWDETDEPSSITNDGRIIIQPFEPIKKFDVLYDLTTLELLGRPFLNELAELGGNEPKYNQKKATEPLSALIINFTSLILP